MRSLLILASLSALGLLGACASTPEPAASAGSSDYDRLLKQCTDRGGILVSVPGATSPNDAVNYSCNIVGIPPNS
jgi:hypothetical protein